MRRLLGGWLLVSALLGQSVPPGRDASQEAYRTWRQADPALERDAAAGATLGARADKVAAQSVKYFGARKDYLDGLEKDVRQKVSALEGVSVAPDTVPNMEPFLAAQNTLLGSNIAIIARDPDRGIQQLRQALERERASIVDLTASLKDTRKNQEAATQAASSAERARTQVSEDYRTVAAGLRQSAAVTEQSGAAWANYYRVLSDAARAVGAPVSSAVTGRAPNAADAGAASARAVTPVPLARYVGEWIYPPVGAHYHGPQPESVSLVVREENGRGSGTLSARFKLSPGGAGEPQVRFDFTGTFQNSRSQSFAITTSNGAKGTLELIPGPAFNLLEVNFTTDEKPGMTRQANFLLLKK